MLEKSILFRIILIGLLAVAVGTMVFLSHRKQVQENVTIRDNPAVAVARIDQEVDTLLAQFGIAPEWIKKKSVAVTGSDFQRTERKVLIPVNLLPVRINLAFNEMARRYGGRAVASENMKENTVTIHLDMGGTILQTIILKPARELPETSKPVSSKRS
jgi:hypothetical protein